MSWCRDFLLADNDANWIAIACNADYFVLWRMACGVIIHMRNHMHVYNCGNYRTLASWHVYTCICHLGIGRAESRVVLNWLCQACRLFALLQIALGIKLAQLNYFGRLIQSYWGCNNFRSICMMSIFAVLTVRTSGYDIRRLHHAVMHTSKNCIAYNYAMVWYDKRFALENYQGTRLI